MFIFSDVQMILSTAGGRRILMRGWQRIIPDAAQNTRAPDCRLSWSIMRRTKIFTMLSAENGISSV